MTNSRRDFVRVLSTFAALGLNSSNVSGQEDPRQAIRTLGERAIGKIDTGNSGRPTDPAAPHEVSVKDFGARGDGVADDSDAIVAAIRAVRSGRILFPAGSYLYTKQLPILNHYTEFVGDGPRQSLLRPSGASAAFVPGDSGHEERHGCVWRALAVMGMTGAETAFRVRGGAELDGCTWEEVSFSKLAYAFDTEPDGRFTGNRLLFLDYDNAPTRFVSSGDINQNLFFWNRWSGTRSGSPAHSLQCTNTTHAGNRHYGCTWESNRSQALQIKNQVLCVVEQAYFEHNNLDAVVGLPWIDQLGGGDNGLTVRDCYFPFNTTKQVFIGKSTPGTTTAALFITGSADNNGTNTVVDRTKLLRAVVLHEGEGGTLTVNASNGFSLQANGVTQFRGDATGIGFFGATPSAPPVLSIGTGHTTDDVIAALQRLGLLRQV